MDIREIISEELKKIFKENYPSGAEYDSNAPWKSDDNIRAGEVASESKLDIIFSDDSEFAIFKDANGNKYIFYIQSLDKEDYEPYANREEKYLGRDEDGMPSLEYGDWDIDGYVIYNYVNNNLDKIKVGNGLEDAESGDYKLVKIDDELRTDLASMAKYYKNEKTANDFLEALGVSKPIQEGVSIDNYTKTSGDYFNKMLVYLKRIKDATESNPEFSDDKKEEILSIIESMIDSVKNHIKQMIDAVGIDDGLEEMFSDKIIRTDRMMTPTGTLFFMDALEESAKKLKDLLHEHKKDNKRGA